MREIYLLTERDSSYRGANVLVDVFTSEEALKAYLGKHLQLKSSLPSGTFTLGFDKEYLIQKMQANDGVVIEQDPNEILKAQITTSGQEWDKIGTESEPELATLSITVWSQTYPNNETYGVSVAPEGEVVGCTCKAFEFHNQIACKHMMGVAYYETPANFGLHQFTIAREFYNDPWNAGGKTTAQNHPIAGTLLYHRPDASRY
jgi:hypothetical protein